METFGGEIEVHIANANDLWQVRELAEIIFPVTYEKIVDDGQVPYMMNLIYTPAALKSQLDTGQVFLLIYFKTKAAGFAAYSPLSANGDFKLNKIYLDYRIQGQGLGRFLLTDVISKVKAAGGKTLLLNVNKHNKARGFYEAMGFTLLKEEKVDIGNGFFMDDYVFSLNLNP